MQLANTGKSVFTVYDLAKTIGKSVPYASLLLSKSRKAHKIERGRYYIDGTDPYIIASNMLFPSYVSLQAGLQYYGLMDQNTVRYSVISQKRHRSVDVQGITVEFIKPRREMFFGYINKSGAYMASPEKLFIDCIYFGRVPFHVLKDAVNTALREGVADPELIKAYAIRSGSKVLSSKIGSLLDGICIDADSLLGYRYKNYVHIHDSGEERIDRKWGVIYDR